MAQQDKKVQASDNPEYDAFVEKFKPKKTTDDCYTPDNIYQVVLEFVCKEYAIPDGARIVRPFWPGADYQTEDYSGDCVVIDNPPFSILSKICKWYTEREIRFFLFAPTLTLFSTRADNFVVCGAQITYDNGAKVNTSFVTNMGESKIYVCPELNQIIKARNKENEKQLTREIPKYTYPRNATTAALLGYLANHDTPLRIHARDASFVSALDAQRDAGKSMFGGGFLLSEKAAAEKAAAEKAAALRWSLSEREQGLIRKMSNM